MQLFECMIIRKAISPSKLPVIKKHLDKTICIFGRLDYLDLWCTAIRNLQYQKLRSEIGVNAFSLFKRNIRDNCSLFIFKIFRNRIIRVNNLQLIELKVVVHV